MSHLAFLGSHRVNGVSALHTGLMRETVFRDLHNLFPDRIVNVTNGIAFRRWLHEANPRLTRLLVDTVGPRILDDENALEKIRPLANDRAFQKRFAAGRYANKLALSDLIRRELATLGFSVIDGNSPVVAVVIPDEIMLFQMARELLEEGIYVNGVARPAATQNLIRISCTAAHTEAHAWRLIEVMERLAKRLNLELEKPAKAARLAL